MPATGYIQIRAYESRAQLPLRDVAITVTIPDGTAIAMGITDRNGRLPSIAIPAPDKSESLIPNPEERPYALINIYSRLSGYEQVEMDNVQIFADTVTDQDIELIPLAEFPDSWDQVAVFLTPPQNL